MSKRTKVQKYYCMKCGKVCTKHSFFEKYNPENGKEIYNIAYICPDRKSFLGIGNGHSVFYGVFRGGEYFVPFVEENNENEV